ncbi:pentatricopeptide repeat-containing protein At3g18970-like [Zingiber officinale]|uniref:pentatricopeptide repeat-containing protein At3g18970-like n=1 Tax=Zingiber officinale TaxID=94328 RepID=UPI001C4D5587|nr:pentatricopeptide repeat-containing protein At3g18970-like [Zingiber officinale]
MLLALPRARCSALLQFCSAIEQVKQIHAQLIVNALLAQPSAVAKLVERYHAVAGGNGHVRLIFHHHHCSSSSLVSNAMLLCTRPEDALSLFSHQNKTGLVTPDRFAYTCALSSCAQLNALLGGTQVQALIAKSGFMSDVVVSTTAVHFYASCGDVGAARQVFDEMTSRNSVTWNALMTGFCLNDRAEEAVSVFDEMLRHGLRITERTAIVLLSACSQLGDLALGSTAHGYIYKAAARFEDCVFTGTGLVDMYCKCGSLTSASKVFDDMTSRNVLTWSAMIGGLAIHGEGKAALRLMEEMVKAGFWPNAATFTGLLFACVHRGLVDEGVRLFDVMKSRFDVEPCMKHYGCMVDLLGRAGMVREAYEFVKAMPVEPDVVVWRALLGACRIHGHEELGEEVGKILLQWETRSARRGRGGCEDFIALSNMYASAERWEDVSTIRREMKKNTTGNRPGQSTV